MSIGRRWAALSDSLRLVPTDAAWLLKGVVLGYVGYTGWVVVTGGLLYGITRVVGLPPFEAPLSTTAVGLGALAGLLWLLLPGLAAVWYATRAVTNLRDNLEKRYRTPYPLVLVVPPAALLLAGVVAGLVVGSFSTALLVALVAPALLLAVRVYAYSYRVFTLSSPVLGKAVVFLTAVGLFGGWFAHVVFLAGEQARIAPLLEALGVAGLSFGTVDLAGYSAVTVPLAVVALPVVASVAYLLVQLAASATTLARNPSVASTAVRPGQRVPGSVTVTQPSRSPRPNVGSGGAEASGGSSPSESGAGSAMTGRADADATPGTDGSADDESDRDEQADDDLVSEPSDTRVFTPDGSAGSDDTQVYTGDGDGDDSTKLYAGGDGPDPDRCPSCNASLGFDADVAFCPNCGASLSE